METVISILTRFVADAAWCCADSPRVDCTFPTGNEMTLALAREPGRSTWFHTEMFLADAALQREIQHQLTIDHQKEMDEALKSSGNAHNPKLEFLYSALKPAISKSVSMTYLARCADSYGYSPSIHILGGEKLQFRRQNFHAERFVEPECRIYGICGFLVRKRGVESKKSLTARIVCIGAGGKVISDEIKKIENIMSGTCGG